MTRKKNEGRISKIGGGISFLVCFEALQGPVSRHVGVGGLVSDHCNSKYDNEELFFKLKTFGNIS